MPEGDTVFLAGHRLNEALAGRRLLRGELRHPKWATADLAGRDVLAGSEDAESLNHPDPGETRLGRLREA